MIVSFSYFLQILNYFETKSIVGNKLIPFNPIKWSYVFRHLILSTIVSFILNILNYFELNWFHIIR